MAGISTNKFVKVSVGKYRLCHHVIVLIDKFEFLYAPSFDILGMIATRNISWLIKGT